MPGRNGMSPEHRGPGIGWGFGNCRYSMGRRQFFRPRSGRRKNSALDEKQFLQNQESLLKEDLEFVQNRLREIDSEN